ncbi:MAG: nucleotide exchange factor GrpE [Muribaculaceae bacterium]|nr:nucleotide exchange factor GrpE [Muribaculaceae bacterium]
MSQKSNKQKAASDNRRVDEEMPEIIDDVEEAVEENNAENETDELSQVDALSKELDETKAQLEKEKKEYLFLMAEFDNFRKRTLKEKSEIIRNASENAMKGLLPIIDDFERGIEANANATDPDAIKEGMELIYNKLVKYLSQNGVKPIESTGVEFNPDVHEAIAMVPVEDPDAKGKVIDTLTKGYTINDDKVLRHAKVAVGQ